MFGRSKFIELCFVANLVGYMSGERPVMLVKPNKILVNPRSGWEIFLLEAN